VEVEGGGKWQRGLGTSGSGKGGESGWWAKEIRQGWGAKAAAPPLKTTAQGWGEEWGEDDEGLRESGGKAGEEAGRKKGRKPY